MRDHHLLDDESVPLLLVGSEKAHSSVRSGSDLESGRLLGPGEGDRDLELLGQVGVDRVRLPAVDGAGVLDLLYTDERCIDRWSAGEYDNV